MKMKLLIVTREVTQDRHYGLGRTLSPVLNQLAARYHEVDYYDQSRIADIHQRWQPSFQRWLRFLFGKLTPAIAERLIQGISASHHAVSNGFSHVWVHDPWLAVGVGLGLLRKKKLRRPFKLVISQHGLGSYAWAVCQDGLSMTGPTLRRFTTLERHILRRADAVFIPSCIARDALLRDLGLTEPPANLSVMGYGRPEIQVASPVAARRYFNLPIADAGLPPNQRVPIILAAGRIAPVKGFPMLIEALGILQHQYSIPAQLIIAGGGSSEPLMKQAQRLQLRHTPIIGFQEDISWSFGAADLYVSTCPVESYGQANREAVAAGIPVIAPAGGGSGEVLGRGARLIPMPRPDLRTDDAGSAQTLAAEMAAILGDAQCYRYWQKQAQQQAASWPSWQSIADLYESRLTAL